MTLKPDEVHVCAHLSPEAIGKLDILVFLAKGGRHPTTLGRPWDGGETLTRSGYLCQVLQHYSPTVPLANIPLRSRTNGQFKRLSIRMSRGMQDTLRKSAGAVPLTTWAEGTIAFWLTLHDALVLSVHAGLENLPGQDSLPSPVEEEPAVA